MSLSKRNKALLYAYERGYRVTKEGTKVLGIRKNTLSLSLSKGGYFYLCVHPIINGERVKSLVNVHRLQAYQKFGDKIFEEGIQVRHLNNDKTDNSWGNIEIGTQSDNMQDSPYVAERAKEMSLEAGLENSPLTEKDVKRIRHLREDKEWTYSQILDEYDIAKSTLSYICNYKTWTHV